jgi:NitT/TauT family transport system substrate-binding protein
MAHAQTPTLKVGIPSLSMFTIMYHVAQDKGFFEKEGVNVEINHFESGSINMRALVARAVDIADVETGLILGSVGTGADLKVFGTQSKRLHFALYAKKEIKEMKGLYGHTFGISGIGGLPHLVLLALLERQKLDVNELKLLSVGGTGARLTALAGGKIDATLGEYSPRIEAEPNLHRLMVVAPELPLYMAQGLVTWADTYESKRDAIERFTRGIVQATRWAYANKEEMLKIAGKHLPLKPDALSQVYDFYVLARVWAINAEIDRELLAYMQDLGLKTKTQTKVVDLDKLIALEVYKKNMAAIGVREYPKK